MIYFYIFMSALISVGVCYILKYVYSHHATLDHLYENLNERMIRIHSSIRSECVQLKVKNDHREDQMQNLNKRLDAIEDQIEEFLRTKKKVGRPRMKMPRKEK